MLGSQPFWMTEWNWFQVQLRLRYLEMRAPNSVTWFEFREEGNYFQSLGYAGDVYLLCYIWSSATRQIIAKDTARQTQEQTYRGWVERTKKNINQILDRLPGLSKQFSIEKNVVFLILDDYGMGSAEVCRFIGDEIRWPPGTAPA